MTRRQPVAPSAADLSIDEVAQLVLGALRTRRSQFDAGMHGVGSAVVTRQELRRVARRGDRAVRAAVQALREAGWPVVSGADHAGYALTRDPEEIEACIQGEFLPRIRSHARVARGLRRAKQMVASLPERQGTLGGVL